MAVSGAAAAAAAELNPCRRQRESASLGGTGAAAAPGRVDLGRPGSGGQEFSQEGSG